MNKSIFAGITLGVIAAILITGTTVANVDATVSGIDKAKKFIEKHKSDSKSVKDIVKKFLDKANGGGHGTPGGGGDVPDR